MRLNDSTTRKGQYYYEIESARDYPRHCRGQETLRYLLAMQAADLGDRICCCRVERVFYLHLG